MEDKMKLKIDREENSIEAKRVTIIKDDIEYRLSFNNRGQLVINKMAIDLVDDIVVMPSSSNEIRVK
ncbi:hypothetical protein CMT48_17210 [Elizabethkingia anophelis]|nr:hypothetical protein [Elizabethkingia anophelis]